MKKLVGAILVLTIGFSLFASDVDVISVSTPVSSSNQAVVYLKGMIGSTSTKISAYNEAGVEIDQNSAVLSFDFPATETWEIAESIYFRYTSNLPTGTYGKLSFALTDMQLDEENTLSTSLELESEHPMTRVEGGNTFFITFLPGSQKERDIGKLTIKVKKEVNDIFTAGSYRGSFSVNYTDGL